MMKKRSNKLVIRLSLLVFFLVTVLVLSFRYFINDRNENENRISDLKRQLKGAESPEQKLHRQAYEELLCQYSGENLLYSNDLKCPIRTVSENNWELMEFGFLFNFINREIHKNSLSLSTSFSDDYTVLAFYYMPVESNFSSQKEPPKEGWIEIDATAKGKYVLPLTNLEHCSGCKFIAIKYLLDNDKIYYGLIALLDPEEN